MFAYRVAYLFFILEHTHELVGTHQGKARAFRPHLTPSRLSSCPATPSPPPPFLHHGYSPLPLWKSKAWNRRTWEKSWNTVTFRGSFYFAWKYFTLLMELWSPQATHDNASAGLATLLCYLFIQPFNRYLLFAHCARHWQINMVPVLMELIVKRGRQIVVT